MIQFNCTWTLIWWNFNDCWFLHLSKVYQFQSKPWIYFGVKFLTLFFGFKDSFLHVTLDTLWLGIQILQKSRNLHKSKFPKLAKPLTTDCFLFCGAWVGSRCQLLACPWSTKSGVGVGPAPGNSYWNGTNCFWIPW